MDSSKKFYNPSPEESTNILSKLFYCWVLPFFKLGYKNDLQVKDIYNTVSEDLSGPLGDELERNWLKEVNKAQGKQKPPSLKAVIFKTFYKSYLVYGIWLFLQCVIIKMLQPIVLAKYIAYYDLSSENKNAEIGWILAIAVVAMAFINVVVMHYCTIGCQRVGMRVRIACSSLVYRKVLRLNRASLGKTASGQLVNLLSNDVLRFDLASGFLHYIWIMPIQTVLALYVMYTIIGLAAVPTILTITIQAVLGQGYLSKLQGKFRSKIAELTDGRVKLMSEITSGIQVIKMYAWEKPFEKMVEYSRKKEIHKVALTSYIKGITVAMGVFTERTILFIAVLCYVYMGHRISGDVVFAVAQLVNTVQLYMTIYFPNALSSYAEAKVSIRRLEQFLLLEETQSISDSYITENPGSVKIIKASASWIPNPIVDTLMDVNLDIKPGTLCCVVGNVGSGKSSLLQLLLKELPLSCGEMLVSGRVSYASQEPWLFVSSVRNNILFGLPYIKQRYKEVVKVCALETDFKQFTHGDKTLVGERGVSMSGGQRARINLARSVYRDADVYLFDDPLSAVDTHVAKHLFEECIKNYLKTKTRILVTHQLQFLKQADMIVFLNNGRVEKVGRFSDLSKGELKTLERDTQHTDEMELKPEKLDFRQRLHSIVSTASTIGERDDDPQETHELIDKGKLSMSTYVKYYRSGSSVVTILSLVALMIISQAVCNASDLWVTYWTNKEELRYNLNRTYTSDIFTSTEFYNFSDVTTTVTPLESNDTYTTLQSLSQILENSTEIFVTNDTISNSTYLEEVLPTTIYAYIYLGLIIGTIILTSFRSCLFFKICMDASKGLHKMMFSNVLKAPMRFFDTNPSGRILSRFSKDMGAVDEILPRVTLDTIQIFLVMAGILAMVFIKIQWMMVPSVFLGVLFYYLRVLYLTSAQDLKRLEGVTKAPVFSHMSASLYGISTIRSANAQKIITDEFDNLQDQHSGTWILFLFTSEAFGFYLDFMSTIFLAMVTFQYLIFGDENTLSGNVGLVISQSMILTGMLQFGVRQSAEVTSNMTSVERILQYTNLDEEGPFESLPAKRPPKGWPSKGKITFENTYLKYTPVDAPVLKNLNLKILPSEKVGIVGRTGAGKSSLISSLFRLAIIDGKIVIDDVDVGEIGLNDLRSNISIIPQEPILFSNTVRYNLDPFGKHTDDVLWRALENVELRGAIESLDQEVSEAGSNFSAGQRQLVCLARAILRNNKILVMDEATANVDPYTDALIQQSIRKNFKNCTVLTIAHRLNTVMDSDKILVMDAGRAMEFDHPHLLLQNPEGYLSGMVNETGPAMQETLRKVAREAYEQKYSSKNIVIETN